MTEVVIVDARPAVHQVWAKSGSDKLERFRSAGFGSNLHLTAADSLEWERARDFANTEIVAADTVVTELGKTKPVTGFSSAPGAMTSTS